MPLIYQTDNYMIEAPENPLVTRLDGGHITITPKLRVADRTRLSPRLAIECMWLSMTTGEAMEVGLKNRGIDIGRINYQDNGNWGVFTPEGPYFHLHLYGRSRQAKIQKYGEACYFPLRETGFYKDFEPLTAEDVAEVRAQIERLTSDPRYLPNAWRLE